MKFEAISQPVSFLAYQLGGPLSVVRDAEGFYWIIEPETGWIHRPRYASLDTALSEASSTGFLEEGGTATPQWAVESGQLARDLFAGVWAQV